MMARWIAGRNTLAPTSSCLSMQPKVDVGHNTMAGGTMAREWSWWKARTHGRHGVAFLYLGAKQMVP